MDTYSLFQGILPTQVSCTADRFFIIWATREAQIGDKDSGSLVSSVKCQVRKQDWAEGETGLRFQLERQHNWLAGSTKAGTALKSCFELGQGGRVFIPGVNPSLDASLPPGRDHELGEVAFFSQGCQWLNKSLSSEGGLSIHHNMQFTCLHKKQDGKS